MIPLAAPESDAPRVVIADDDREFATYMGAWFEAAGYAIDLAGDVAELQAAVAGDHVSLVVLDHDLADADVLDVVRGIRRGESGAFTDILLVLSDPPDERLLQALDAGADDFLRRPFGAIEIRAKVGALARRSRTLRDVSPLTGLAGNHRSTSELRRRIEAGAPVAVAHADLDHFKPYNDHYGFVRGDQVIKFAAHIIQEAVAETDASGQGFVGHIGGDDFIILLDPADVERFCVQMIEAFDDGILDFYDPEDALRGHVELLDRRGGREAFPVVSISVGVATSSSRPFESHFDASTIASEMKEFAKREPGSSYQIDRRSK